MIVLDTDHLSVLQRPQSTQFRVLVETMELCGDQRFATTVVSLEEQMRGWLAVIRRKQNVHDQDLYYTRLIGIVEFFSHWHIVTFNELAADRFVQLRKVGVRIGTMDLKIASITLANDAILRSANGRDFEQVPDLKVENHLI
jgi:tRNA(fMet)-specific endonuclease VapC